MYERGQGVPANPQRAVELYTVASQRGNNEATCHLGYAHERGFGTAKVRVPFCLVVPRMTIDDEVVE